jgi:hypothetical protein
MPLLALTDTQLDLVTRAAGLLPPQQRSMFLQSIANRVGDVASPTDHDVRDAIDFILGCRIGGGNKAFIPETTETQERKGVFR